MPQSRARRGLPDAFEFEGTGDEARDWLDAVFGTHLRLTTPLGAVRHDRMDHGSFAIDHIRIDASFSFDSDPMPGLVVADILGGVTEYTRDGVTDRVADGESALVAGWDMPFTGHSEDQEIRLTTVVAEVMVAAVREVSPDYPWPHVTFTSFVPHSVAAGASWRATVDQLGSRPPREGDGASSDEAGRMLAHTLLETFPNNVMARAGRLERERDARAATSSTLRRAVALVESRAEEDLTPGEVARECGVTLRTLQYAFRNHLGCTPQDYLRRVRLDLARQSFRDGTSTTVSDAATKFGFFNPGRFASDYRQLFRENPRQTLSRTQQ